jgi:hypothetical protein
MILDNEILLFLHGLGLALMMGRLIVLWPKLIYRGLSSRKAKQA